MRRIPSGTLFRFAAFGCLGVTVEVLFTALSALFSQLRAGSPDWTLAGRSYAWMFPIYGGAAILFPPAYARVRRWPLPARLALYGAGILAIEFLCGAALDLLIGHCPWEHHSRFSVRGYIRLDYFPLWAAFGWLIERAHLRLGSQ